MPKRINYRLNEAELETIRSAMKSNEQAVVSRRATAIHLLHLGQRPEEVAQVLAVRPSTIYNWHGRWRTHGVAGLVNGSSPGRPRKADEEYVRLLEETLEREPQEVGQDFTVWTIERLIDYLEQQTGIRLSPSRFGVLLKDHDYVYRRPKHDLKELQDPQARAQAQSWLDELKRGRWPQSTCSSLWTRAPSVCTPSCASVG